MIASTRVVVLGVGVCLFFGAFFFLQTPLKELVSVTRTFVYERVLASAAADVLRACRDDRHRPSCYDERIPALMDRGVSLEDAFAITKLVQRADDSYGYCHVLGHRLSERETAKDPRRWTDVIARCPVGQCSNGCIHGAFQERFRASSVRTEDSEALISEIENVCEHSTKKQFTSMEQATCYHALGHLTMYITEADIPHALALCDRVALKGERDYRRLCYDGVFMQLFQPLEPEDTALVHGKAPGTQREAEKLCAAYTGTQGSSCRAESWPLYSADIETPEGVVAFCNREKEYIARRACYMGLVYVRTPSFAFDVKKITDFCAGFPVTSRGLCFGAAASRIIESEYTLGDVARAVCEAAHEHGVGARCFEELLFYSAYNFQIESEAFKNFCALLPSAYRVRCLNKEGVGMLFPRDDI